MVVRLVPLSRPQSGRKNPFPPLGVVLIMSVIVIVLVIAVLKLPTRSHMVQQIPQPPTPP